MHDGALDTPTANIKSLAATHTVRVSEAHYPTPYAIDWVEAAASITYGVEHVNAPCANQSLLTWLEPVEQYCCTRKRCKRNAAICYTSLLKGWPLHTLQPLLVTISTAYMHICYIAVTHGGITVSIAQQQTLPVCRSRPRSSRLLFSTALTQITGVVLKPLHRSCAENFVNERYIMICALT